MSTEHAVPELIACKQTMLWVKLACTVWAERAVLGHGYRCSDCMRLSVECADVCLAAMRLLDDADDRSRRVDTVCPALLGCARCAAACAIECRRHGSNDAHLKLCLELCRRLERQCRDAVAALRWGELDERSRSGTRAVARPGASASAGMNGTRNP